MHTVTPKTPTQSTAWSEPGDAKKIDRTPNKHVGRFHEATKKTREKQRDSPGHEERTRCVGCVHKYDASNVPRCTPAHGANDTRALTLVLCVCYASASQRAEPLSMVACQALRQQRGAPLAAGGTPGTSNATHWV